MQAVAEQETLPVAEAKAGVPDAWDRLFRRFQLPLYVFVFELVGDRSMSLDIVQETFIRAARHIGGLREEDKFAHWLFRIAHQRCAQFWREKTDDEPLPPEESDALAVDSSPDMLLIRREQEAQFMSRLEQLPAPQRSVVLLHYIEDFSLEEIAGITGASLGTVKSRLHYAKKALRNLLEEP
jgi:RNA polymerase sigma-70 factor, ECF subfamily